MMFEKSIKSEIQISDGGKRNNEFITPRRRKNSLSNFEENEISGNKMLSENDIEEREMDEKWKNIFKFLDENKIFIIKPSIKMDEFFNSKKNKLFNKFQSKSINLTIIKTPENSLLLRRNYPKSLEKLSFQFESESLNEI